MAQGGGIQHDAGTCLTLDKAGNCHVTGWVGSTSRFGNIELPGAYNDRYVFLAKYAETGKLIWVVLGDRVHTMESGYAVVSDLVGNLAILSLAGYEEDKTRPLCLRKFDASGERQESRKFLGEFNKNPNRIKMAIGPAGTYSVMGSLRGPATIGHKTLMVTDPRDMFIANFSSSGGLRWIQRTEGPGDCESVAIAVGSKGAIYAVGRFEGTEHFGSHHPTSRGDRDIFLAKLVTGPP